MYFAVNPWPTGTPECLLASLQNLRDRTQVPGYAYILLDASFDQALPTNFPWRRHVECTLYDDTRLAGLRAVAPMLLGLPDEPEKQATWLSELAEVCCAKPMLSLIYSAIPARALAKHYRPYLLVRTADSLEWPVRWADTRILPTLLASMTLAERKHFLAPLHAWLYVDRTGAICDWRGEASTNPETAQFDCWPLNDARFSQLVGDAEADAVIAALHDTQPDLFDRQEPAAVHACVDKHLAIASQNGVEGAGPRRHFAMLALTLKEDFAAHPAMQALLERTREGASYAAEVAALPAEFWQQTERKN